MDLTSFQASERINRGDRRFYDVTYTSGLHGVFDTQINQLVVPCMFEGVSTAGNPQYWEVMTSERECTRSIYKHGIYGVRERELVVPIEQQNVRALTRDVFLILTSSKSHYGWTQFSLFVRSRNRLYGELRNNDNFLPEWPGLKHVNVNIPTYYEERFGVVSVSGRGNLIAFQQREVTGVLKGARHVFNVKLGKVTVSK